MLMNIDNLETGDILLFSPKSSNIIYKILDIGIRYFTKSTYTHTAIILKDPKFINKSLTGIYMWESSYEGKPDPQDGKIKLGVQLTPFFEFLKTYHGEIYIRKLKKGIDAFTDDKLTYIHDVVYDKPYDIDPSDWINAISRKDADPQKTSRFWCSALVSYILVQIGFLDNDIDWSIVRPSDLSSNSKYLTFKNCDYGDDCKIYENCNLY